jgi:hypothetical protein
MASITKRSRTGTSTRTRSSGSSRRPAARSRISDNPRRLDREALVALVGSASYMPAAGDPRHAPMMAELDALFDAHAENGAVQMLYRTRLHYTRMN